ncbi:P1 family peptidase [Thalassobacillus hwangdonensis]|uniref:P1 family peptidase n=1 Tax=Thalassobacillus hwangdonensis TaxID=546108 RepID=A0ABW3KWZ3_9BACI
MKHVSFSEFEGFLTGHSHHRRGGTGGTVVLCENGAVAGVDVRGGAPGTRETDLLDPENLVEKIHGVCLAGGSAYGLEASSGVMAFLEEHQIGFETPGGKVPIVPSAILYDLTVGDPDIRPDKEMGYMACMNAYNREPLKQGNAGAGTGASVGKILGPTYAMKGGIGYFGVKIDTFFIGAIVVVNSFGDIIDPDTGNVIAGVYDHKSGKLMNTESILRNQLFKKEDPGFSGNTSLGVVMTNVKWSKAQAKKIASISHDGFARTMRPSHTFLDGDTIFTMSTCEVEADLNAVASLAAYVVERAVIQAVKQAESCYGLPAAKHLEKGEG